MADNAAKIAKIRTLLATGAASMTVDGVQTSYNLDSLRKELSRLESEDDTVLVNRPTFASIDLSGF